eukprot:352398-Chlamydomonas_euryale.AAC.4
MLLKTHTWMRSTGSFAPRRQQPPVWANQQPPVWANQMQTATAKAPPVSPHTFMRAAPPCFPAPLPCPSSTPFAQPPSPHRIVSTDCIPKYPDANLPTLLLYNDGTCVQHLSGLAAIGGARTTPEREYGATCASTSGTLRMQGCPTQQAAAPACPGSGCPCAQKRPLLPERQTPPPPPCPSLSLPLFPSRALPCLNHRLINPPCSNDFGKK